MTNYTTGKYRHWVAAILLVAITLMQLGAYRIAPWQPVRARQAVLVKAATPCQQSKTSQSQTGRSCQSQQSGSSQLYSILSAFILFLDSFAGKMYFLFIAALLAAGSHRRIYRPPRLSLSI